MRTLLGRYLLVFGALTSVAQNTTGPLPDNLLTRAQSGDAAAQVELGRAYEDGQGVPQDDGLAVEWFRKAADQGNAGAENSLGVMYSQGKGVPRDKQEAVRWYKRAARQGLPEGLYNVAISYFNGEGAGEDLALAYAWMEMARRKGDAQAEEALKHISDELHGRLDGAKFKLAVLYQKGDEIPADPAAAIALYTEIAQLDIRQSALSGPAQFALCLIYGQGQGVAQDYGAARAWCKKAFKNQELPAQGYLFLGSTAELGEGTSLDLKEAAEWYRLAAFGGGPEGAMRLGRLRLAGGSTQGNRDAYFWFSLAAYRKAPGAEAAQQSVAAKLSPKELADQQKKFSEWIRMRPYDQLAQLKKH
jgi:TPR repeat protein